MTYSTVEHGGQLNKVTDRFNIPVQKWLDLSTGIAPFTYPIPTIPLTYWQQLPQPCAALGQAAAHYYTQGLVTQNLTKVCAKNFLASHGSQHVIQHLPILWRQHNPHSQSVFVPASGYTEHKKSWAAAGFNITHYTQLPNPSKLPMNSVVVLINPNNPTGQLTALEHIHTLLAALEKKQGLLVVDEAFMDTVHPSQSALTLINSPAVIILKSMGKFFGLAGMRLGFVAAHHYWVNKLHSLLGPWPVNGPAQYVGLVALKDQHWQAQQYQKLHQQATQLEHLLSRYFNESHNTITGTLLFKSVSTPYATHLFEQLCLQGIYVRLLDDKSGLRFGLPNDKGLVRFSHALEHLRINDCLF
ncbi:threonine-phosphate decarboxylase [Marinagarivorans algicola]|uniref:threonine-phosphate decarboxylase n=1 Tax=Marinagarivorans algicola TaxID=1513270 RepID=UPI0006B4DA8A|nr:threonine-phosphate decarboxylase [Marinagarivorans algicola]